MLDLALPTRQSKKSILYYLFNNIRGLFIFGLYAIFGMGSWSNFLLTTAVTIAFTAIAIVGPVIKYYFFTFHIDHNELIIQQGLLFKQRKAVPLDRIQSLNMNQNFIQRILGIASLEVETAGSSHKEIEIPALDYAFAKAIKNTLQQEVQTLKHEEAVLQVASQETTEVLHNDQTVAIDGALHAGASAAGHMKAQTAPQVVLKLTVLDLLKVGLTQNHLRSGGIALGVVIGFWYKIKDVVENYYGDPFENWDENLEKTVRSGTFHIADYTAVGFSALLVFCIAAILVSMVVVINKFWDYTMTQDGESLEITMGLFNKRTVKMPLRKVQFLEFHSNPLRKILGYQTARIFQAQSQDNPATAIEVPACKQALMNKLQELIFNEPLETATTVLTPNPWSYARLSVYIMSVFMIPLLVVSVYFSFNFGIIIAIVILIITAFVNYNIGARSLIKRDDSFVIFKKGWLLPKTIIVPIYKVQSAALWRSIFLKRRQEMHITLHTAAGSRKLKYLKEQEVKMLAHEIHSEVIQTSRSWM